MLARLHLAARRAAVPAMPPPVHGDAETRAWFAGLLRRTDHEVWVAERDEAVVGGLRPSGLQLWLFETNVRARRFHRRHGFTEVERTDGADNEERAPDIRMAWPAGAGISPSTPLVP